MKLGASRETPTDGGFPAVLDRNTANRYNKAMNHTEQRTGNAYSSKRWVDLISAGFGSGWSKVAPGTVGTAAALLVWLLFHQAQFSNLIISEVLLLGCTTLIGSLAVRISLRSSQVTDPGWIVIDEWAGIFLALMAVNPESFSQVLCAFALFRFFDIRKPGPVRWAESLPAEYGVMADDLVAGALALALLELLSPLARSFGFAWCGLFVC